MEKFSKEYYPWQRTFHKYFTDILLEKPKEIKDPGPYVSISRDFGCMGNQIAKQLSSELTKIYKNKDLDTEWKWINKEILKHSATELGLKPSDIVYVFRAQQKTTMDEIVTALSSRYYQSDRKIRKTIIAVIRRLLSEGNIIIVGRAGVTFREEIPRSLHIKLKAPLDWRIRQVSKNYNLNPEIAKKYILEVDKERNNLIQSFMGKVSDEAIFDIIFNRKTMTESQIVRSILNVMELKKLL